MKIKPKNIAILTLLCTSFVVAMFDISAGIFLAVFTNTIINYILFSRQKSKTVKVRKSRPATVDEFREKEIKANPHRPYPYVDEFTD